MTQKIINLNSQAVLVATAVCAATALITLWLYKKKKPAVPIEWEPVGKVKELYIYPLKSGRRMQLQTAECTELGFKIPNNSYFRDRCLMVYKDDHTKEYRTARTYPKMLLISVTPDNQDNFILAAPEMEELKFKVPILNQRHYADEIDMWQNERVLTIDCGNEVAEWISRYILGKPHGLRLGFHNGAYKRDIETVFSKFAKVYSKLKSDSMGMYSDLSSYSLINKTSVDDLVNRMPNSSVTFHYFRPNILIDGEKLQPYVEDDWDWIKIGQIVFRNVKPCTRCMLTVIDPETATRSANHEPLRTLKTYRKVKGLELSEVEGDSPVMGIYMGLKNNGNTSINVGDNIYVGKKLI